MDHAAPCAAATAPQRASPAAARCATPCRRGAWHDPRPDEDRAQRPPPLKKVRGQQHARQASRDDALAGLADRRAARAARDFAARRAGTMELGRNTDAARAGPSASPRETALAGAITTGGQSSRRMLMKHHSGQKRDMRGATVGAGLGPKLARACAATENSVGGGAGGFGGPRGPSGRNFGPPASSGGRSRSGGFPGAPRGSPGPRPRRHLSAHPPGPFAAAARKATRVRSARGPR